MQKVYTVIFLTVIIAFTACNNKFDDDNNMQVFRYNEVSGIATLDPAFARDQAHIWTANHLYNGLVELDDKLVINSSIAKKWNISDDGKTYTFTLRDDVFFHDHELFDDAKGRKVTAYDFEYSFNRIVDDKVSSPGRWVFNYVENINGEYGFNALNDSVFQIKLSSPFPPFLGILSMKYCSVVAKEIVEYYGDDYRTNPIGTGPFKMAYWKEGVKLVLTKNTNYFEYDSLGKQLPYLDAVSISFIIDKQSAFLQFIMGKLDFLSGIDASYKDEILTKSGQLNPKYAESINMSTSPYLNTEYLGFLMDNNTSNALRDKRVRQAINYGFDREKMIKYLRNNIGIPAQNGFIPKGLQGFKEDSVFYYYNPDLSRELLEQAGYPNGQGLGDITINTTASYLDLCEYIQAQLSEIGVKIDINVNHAGTLREMIAKSELDFFRGSWIADYPDAENYLALFYSPNFCPQGSNYTHFSSPQFDSLYVVAGQEVNDSIRYGYYADMDRLIMDQSPVLVLYYDQVLRFSHKYVKNLGNNPINLLDLKRVKCEK